MENYGTIYYNSRFEWDMKLSSSGNQLLFSYSEA